MIDREQHASIDNQNKESEKRDLISLYGATLRNNASKKVVDIGRYIEIDFDFQIHRIEHLVKEFNGFMPPNRIAHYVIALIKDGSGFKSIGHHDFKVHPKMAMIIPRYDIHSSNKWSLENKGYMLSFNHDFFLKMNLPKSLLNLSSLFKTSRKPYQLLSEQETQKLSLIFEDIFSEQSNNYPLKKK